MLNPAINKHGGRKIVRSQPAKKYVRNILILPQLAPVAASMLRIRAPDQKDAPVHRYEGFYLANHEKAKSHRYQQPLRSNSDLLQERNLSRMAFLLIPVKEELIIVLKFIESLRTRDIDLHPLAITTLDGCISFKSKFKHFVLNRRRNKSNNNSNNKSNNNKSNNNTY